MYVMPYWKKNAPEDLHQEPRGCEPPFEASQDLSS